MKRLSHKEGKTILRARSGRTRVKQCLLGSTRPVYQELTATVVAYTRPAQDQAGKHSIMEWEGIPEPIPVPEELWKCNEFLRKESPFVIRV